MTSLAKLTEIIKDPWVFAEECCYTYDPQDQKNPVKKFPAHFKYLKIYFRTWQQKRMLAVPKSRRMFLSWATLILYLHEAMFRPGKKMAFVSKREEDADELINRVEFILKKIQEMGLLPPDLMPKYKRTYCLLDFYEIGSTIEAYPSGSDQLRMHGFSGIMGDEMAFWPFPEKMYASAMPTIEGGGRFTAISSPAPGLFKDLVFDALKGNDGAGGSKQIVDAMQGVKIWQNPKNSWWVFELHYTANPAKRDPAYIDIMRRSMPKSQFMQEFELQWESYIGSPVYPDFNIKHLSRNIHPELGLPLLIGFDFGLTPAAVICQAQGQKLVVIKEYTAVNMGIKSFLDKIVLPGLRVDFPIWNDRKKDYLCFIDPAGIQRAQSDESTCVQFLAAAGFSPIKGEMSWEKRRSSVEHYLIKFDKDGPFFLIDEEKCPVLVKGFQGEYRYPDQAMEVEPAKLRPIKNESSHPHDALQYVASKMAESVNRRPVQRVPSMSYGFNGFN